MIKQILLLLIGIPTAFGQIITSNVSTPIELVNNSMVGHGIEIISVTSQGAPFAYGSFTGSGSTFGFDHGIILTNGIATWGNGPDGPNNSPNAGYDNSSVGYSLLNNLTSPELTFNATVFEITFKPAGDSIFLICAFGSEEYKEYVGSEFGDPFGVFLTGPNPEGGMYIDKNIALVPGTNSPITINNISHLTNSTYYVDNIEPTPGTYTQYDGHTVALTLRKKVIADSIYTLKIGIADAADAIYDSGVFIKAHSFSSGEYIGIEQMLNEDFIIYPVPTDNHIQMNSTSGKIIESISIADQSGRVVLSQIVQTNNWNVNVEDFPSGIYTISLSTSMGSSTRKIIIR